MLFRSLLIILFLVSRSLINCQNTFSLFNQSIIENAINRYRKELICSKAATNMEYIISDKQLVYHAKYLISNNRTIHDNASYQLVTAETCGYKYTNSTKLNDFAWVWNPKFTTIGCAISLSDEKFIWCVFKKPKTSADFNAAVIQYDNSTKYIDTLKHAASIFNKMRCSDKPRIKLTSCYLTTSIRKSIIKEMNNIRQNEAKKKCYHLPQIDWDFNLEIASIETSKYAPGSIDDECFPTSGFLNGIGIYEFETDFIVQPNLDKLIPDLIRNATEDVNSRNNLLWLYGTQLNAIGCTLFTIGGRGKFLCTFNKRKYCFNNYYPILCTPPENEIKSCNSCQLNLGLNSYIAFVATILVTILIVVIVLKLVQNRKPQTGLKGPTTEPIYAEIKFK